jgi:hypothetical protein
MTSARPLLLGSSLSQAFVEELEQNTILELMEAKIPYCSRVVSLQARKKK